MLLFQDVTAQRRVEEANRLQSNLIDRVEQAVIVTDLDGKVTFWNRFAETLYGWKASEATGKNIVQLLTYDLTSEQEEGIKQQLRQGKSWSGEYPVKKKNGQLFQAYINQVPFFNPRGELIGVIGVSFDNSERRQRDFELETIVSISSALRIAETAEEMDEIIIDKVVSLLNVDAASVEIVDPVTKDSEYKAAFGPWKSMEGYVQPHGTGLNAIIERTLRPYQTDNIETDPNLAYMRNLYPNLRGAAGLPMIAKDELIGFLWIARVTELFTNDVKLASSISEIAANAIRRSRLHENVQQLLFSLNEAYDTTLQGWADALELRDQETMGHSRRVVEMTVRLARKIGVPESDIPDIRRGTILHDIGKMGVPDAILRKPGPLTAEEWEIMRQHPVYAYKLLEPIKYLSKAIDIPYCHHEKWDGSGYPRGLKGEEIPLFARIFAIVDVWDALGSERPYKKAWSIDEVKQYLKENSGSHFDPKIVPAFLELLAEIEETKGIPEEKA